MPPEHEQPQRNSPEGKPESGATEEAFYRMEHDELAERKAHIRDTEELLAFVKELMEQYPLGKYPGISVTMGSSLEDVRAAAMKEEGLAKGRGAAEIPRLNNISKMIGLLKDETFVAPWTPNVRELLITTNKQLRREKAGLKSFEKGL